MKAEEALKKIAELLGAKFSETPQVELKEYPTMDGTMITIDGEIAPGSAVYVTGESGQMPCPDGDVTLADGTALTVQAGLIVDVKAPAPAPEMSSEVKTLSDRVEKLEELLNTTMQAQKNAAQEHAFYAEKQRAAIETLTEALKEVAGSASTPPVETPKHDFGKKSEKFESLLTTLKNIKK